MRAAIGSHPDIDLKKMSSGMSDITYDMMEIVPYLTRSGSESSEGLRKEREDAAEMYKRVIEQEAKVQKNLVQANPNPERKEKPEKLKIVPIGDKKK